MYKNIEVSISPTNHGRLALNSIPLRGSSQPLASIPSTPEAVIDLITKMVCEQRACRPRVGCRTEPVMDDTVPRGGIPSEACTEWELGTSGRKGVSSYVDELREQSKPQMSNERRCAWEADPLATRDRDIPIVTVIFVEIVVVTVAVSGSEVVGCSCGEPVKNVDGQLVDEGLHSL